MRRRSIAALIVMSLAALLCASLGLDQASATTSPHHLRVGAHRVPRVNHRTGLPIGMLPTHSQLHQTAQLNARSQRMSSARRNTSAPYQLTYYGGPVVSNVQVQPVWWGSGHYIPQVTNATSPNMQTAFTSITGASTSTAPYLGALAEYSTPATGGTGQTIGTGSVLRGTMIKPTIATGSTVYDSQIITELVNQFNNHTLALPSVDAQGYANTTYVLYFPSRVTVCQDPSPGSTTDCSNNAFCGYHSSFAVQDPSTQAVIADIRYIVLPDTSSSTWLNGCSSYGADTPYTGLQSVASHELAEAITDPDVAEAPATCATPTNCAPLGWYDGTGTADDNGEIADICQEIQGGSFAENSVYRGPDGQNYVAQNLWSNEHNSCVPTLPVVTFTSVPPAVTQTSAATVRYFASDANAPDGITYDVAYKAARWNGSWGSLVTAASRTTSNQVSVPVSPGMSYCLVVRAHDTAGAVSPWSSPRCTTVPLDDYSIGMQTAGWTRTHATSAYRGTLTTTRHVGAQIGVNGASTGQVGVVMETCSTCGNVQIWLGKTLLRTVSTHAATTHYRVVWLSVPFGLRTTPISLRAASGLVAMDGLVVTRAAPSF